MRIQDRGQFYVRDVSYTRETIPVDNFLFITSEGIEVKLDHCGSPFIGVKIGRDHYYKFLPTDADALRTMAGVLEGSISLAEIETWST